MFLSIRAGGIARKLAQLLNGQIDDRKGPHRQVLIRGEHRGRQVQVTLDRTWGYATVVVTTNRPRDMYFILRSAAGLKSMAGRGSEYEALSFGKDLLLERGEHDRLDARRVLADLDPGLRDRMLSVVSGRSAWRYTADGLEHDRIAVPLSGAVEHIRSKLELACDVADAIEALAAQGH